VGVLRGLVCLVRERDDEVVAILSSDTNGLSLEFTTNSKSFLFLLLSLLHGRSLMTPPFTTGPGVQAWSGTGGYDGQDSRRKIHGGKAQENIGDGYNVPPAFAMEFHSGESPLYRLGTSLSTGLIWMCGMG
jgi:hypothetical protein